MAVIDWARAGQPTVGSQEAPPTNAEPMPLLVAPSRIEAADSSNERLAAMVERYFDLVWRTLRRLGVVDSALDDGAQQVFIVATRKLATIEASGERAYLVGIAVRVASDSRRTWRRRREVAEDDAREPIDPQLSPEELVDQKRARELLDRVLQAMPMDLRAAFTMFEIEGMTAPEIATALEIPLGTVSSRLRRAREAFREQVAHLQKPEGGDHA